MNKRNLFLIVFYLSFYTIIAQEITGVVIDSKTNEPLNGASVYYNNTTYGTITNVNGEFSIQDYKDLNTPLIISFMGYEKFVLENLFFKKDLVIPLVESLNLLNEVSLSSNDNWPWALKLEEFKEHFLGRSDRGKACSIANEEALILKYDSKTKTLSAKSKEPIAIESRELGYIISVDLKHFVARYSYVSKNNKRRNVKLVNYYSSNHYRSLVVDSISLISQKRIEAYQGSVLHFMRALSKNNLKQEGFQMFLEKGQYVNNTRRHFEVIPIAEGKSVKVIFENKMNVLYKGTRQSSIKCTEKEFYIDNFGNHTPPEAVIFTGDLGDQRMGDSLPLDFQFTPL